MDTEWLATLDTRLGLIERRLSRIEGGLILLGFVLGLATPFVLVAVHA